MERGWRHALMVLVLISTSVSVQADADIVVLVITHGSTAYDDRIGEGTKQQVVEQLGLENVAVLISHREYNEEDKSWGHHAVWPLLPRIVSSHPSLQWFLIMEMESRMNGQRLRQYLNGLNATEELMIGRGLVDLQPVITHHFYGFDSDGDDPPFMYPDFASGVLISGPLLRRIADVASTALTRSDFTIDAKHEFARFTKEVTRARLRSEVDHFCMSDDGKSCIVWFEQQTGSRKSCLDRPPINQHSLFVAIKTYSAFHRSRIVIAKRTWTKDARHIVYYSDIEDPYIPSVAVDVENTERGHCEKTMRILADVLRNNEMTPSIKWILIADDDTLLSLPRLYRWLRCYDESKPMILGERYGYGYSVRGDGGYDYPTGGSGMVFSLSAVRLLVDKCACPQIDSPDDMIIGMCARNLKIPIVHSPAMHQARSIDYPRSYLSRLPPISFHKHEGIDPYEQYAKYLHEADNVHTEL